MQSKSKIIARVFSALYLSTAALTIGFIPHDGYAATETGKANPFSKKSGMYQVHELTDVLTSAQSKKEKDLAAHNIIALLASGGKVSFNAKADDESYEADHLYAVQNDHDDSSKFFCVRDKEKGRSDDEWREALRSLTYAYQYLSSEKGVNRIFDVWSVVYPEGSNWDAEVSQMQGHVRWTYFLYHLIGTVKADKNASLEEAKDSLNDALIENKIDTGGPVFSEEDIRGKAGIFKLHNTDFNSYVKQCVYDYMREQLLGAKPKKPHVDKDVDNTLLDFADDVNPHTASNSDFQKGDLFVLDELPIPNKGVPLAVRLPEESIPKKKREKPKFAALTNSKKLLENVTLDYREEAIKKLIDAGTFSDEALKSYRESRYTHDYKMQLIPVDKWELLNEYCYTLYGEHLISSRELERQKALTQLSNRVIHFYSAEKELKELIEKEDLSVDDREKLEKAFTNFNTPNQYINLALNITDEKYAAFEVYYKALHGGEELLPPYQKRLREARKGFSEKFTYMPGVAKKVLDLMDQPAVDKKTVKLIKKAFTETRIQGNDEFANTIDDQTLEALEAYFQILHPKAGDIVSQKITNLRQAASTLGNTLGQYNSDTVKRMIGLVKKEKLEQDDLSDIDKTVTSYSISNHNFELSMTIKDKYVNALDDYSRALHKRDFMSEEQKLTRNAIQKLSKQIGNFYSNEQVLLTAIEKYNRDNIDQILIKTSRNSFSDNLVFIIDDKKLDAFQEFFEFKHLGEDFVSEIAKKSRNAVTQLSVTLKNSYSESLHNFYILVDKKIKGQMKADDAASFERTVLNYWTHNFDTKIDLNINSAHLKAFEDYYRELAGKDLLSEDQQRKRNALEKLVASMKDKIFSGKDKLTKIRTPNKIDNTFITSLKFVTDSDKALAQYFVDLYDGKEDTDAQEWAQWVAYIKEQLAEQQ